MRLTLAMMMMASSFAWTACSTAVPAGDGAVRIELGQSFSLRVGEVAQTADGGLRVGFEGVSADSRCPKGEQCVWAGDAVARVWLQQGTGPRAVGELHTAQGAPQTLRLQGLELRLLRLDPYPVSGRTVAPGAHVATLSLIRGSSTEPDR